MPPPAATPQPAALPTTDDGLPRRKPGAHLSEQLRDSVTDVEDAVPSHDIVHRTPEQVAAQFAGFPTHADPDEESSP